MAKLGPYLAPQLIVARSVAVASVPRPPVVAMPKPVHCVPQNGVSSMPPGIRMNGPVISSMIVPRPALRLCYDALQKRAMVVRTIMAGVQPGCARAACVVTPTVVTLPDLGHRIPKNLMTSTCGLRQGTGLLLRGKRLEALLKRFSLLDAMLDASGGILRHHVMLHLLKPLLMGGHSFLHLPHALLSFGSMALGLLGPLQLLSVSL